MSNRHTRSDRAGELFEIVINGVGAGVGVGSRSGGVDRIWICLKETLHEGVQQPYLVEVRWYLLCI